MKRSEQYKKYFTEEYLMGPNSIRILDELLTTYPLKLQKQNKILDLGCGTGLTSLFITNETNATIYANDLWTKAEDNVKRFEKWNISEWVIPFQEDANNFHFEQEFFDAIISVDAYHYFAGKEGFFIEKILPFVKSGGMVLIAIPGIKEEYEGKQSETIRKWIGEDDYMFHSCSWWKRIIGEHQDIEFVKIWELKSFTMAWSEWLQIDNELANGDRKFYESIINKYTNFIGIAVKKK